MRVERVWLSVAGVFILGLAVACQGPAPVPTPPSSSSFEHLWTAYTHCVSTSDADAARRQADVLHQAAHREQDRETFLPRTLDRYVEKPPSRLAADPRALANACRAHADRMEQGRVHR